MFELYAEKTKLTLNNGEPMTSGSVMVYQVHFEFSDDWNGLERTAVFQAGCVEKFVLLDDSGECFIPWEVLEKPGRYLMVGVCGRYGDSVVLPTQWTSLGMVLEGAVIESGVVPDTLDPSFSVTADHRALRYRDAPEQHPIASITGLEAELNRIPEAMETLTNAELEEILK